MMKCRDCPYLWKDNGDTFECCHFPPEAGEPPCELITDEKEEEDDE